MTYNGSMENKVVVYYFRAFVGTPMVNEVAEILNESLHFRAFAAHDTGTVWGTVELPHDEFPRDAFRDATYEILGYRLGAKELRRATSPMNERIARERKYEREGHFLN